MMRNCKLQHQRGALLISLIVTMVIMAALGSGMLYYSTTSSYGQYFANRQAMAYYLGESGANYALKQFNPSTNYTNGPFPNLTTFTLSNGQFAVKTYDKPGDATRLIIEATGIVGSGWLTTRQLVTKNISKANPGSPGGGPATAPVGFGTTTDQFEEVWDTITGDVKIVDTGPSGGPALQFKGKEGAIRLDWHDNAPVPDLLEAWNSNGQLLSYVIQVKINVDREGSNGKHYMMGITFRLVDDSNSYGVSFYRSYGASGRPDWQESGNFADFLEQIPDDGKNYAVLWKKVDAAYTVLDFTPLSPAYGVVTDASAQELTPWSALFIRLNERFDGPGGARQNHLKVYVQGPASYPRGTINWNFPSFNQVAWTWTRPPQPSPPITEVLDGTFTSAGFNNDIPEIGIHALYDSNASNDQFFTDFAMAIQGTGSGGGNYQY